MSGQNQPDYVDEERLIAAFIRSKRSASTKATYAQRFDPFAEWCKQRGVPLLEVATSDIKRFTAELSSRDLAPITIASYEDAISSFFTFAKSEGLLSRSPMEGFVRTPKPRGPRKSPIQADQFRALVRWSIVDSDVVRSAVVLLIAINGMHASEVCAARIEDLFDEGGILHLRIPRRRNSASTPLPDIVAERVRSCAGSRSGDQFLLSIDEVDRHRVGRLVARAGVKAGVGSGLTPSALRLGMIAAALQGGSTAASVAEAVGIDDLRGLDGLVPLATSIHHHPAFVVAAVTTEPAVSTDLMRQVSALLHDPLVHPVAPIVISCAVLESHLRSLVGQAGLRITGNPSLSRYNDALRAANALTTLQWRQVQVIGDLRNKVAHGEDLDSLSKDTARRVAEQVAELLSSTSAVGTPPII